MMKKNTEAGDDMTQKERILNAKHCLDALALGLDPATGAELPDDSVLNRVELSRCFFFVSGLLQELHERILNEMADPFVYRQLRTTTITNWLLHAGFLEVSAREGGTPTRRPTALGRTIGLSAEERSGKRGTYTVTLYGPEAQRFILDNLDAMLRSESQPLG